MKKACFFLSNDDYLCQNKIFIPPDNWNKRFDPSYFYSLKETFSRYGYDLSTQDINTPEESDIVIYINLNPQATEIKEHPNSYLMITENELIIPCNWNKENHKFFKKVFTWNDEIVDNFKYYKLPITKPKPKYIKTGLEHKEKFCTLIAGNKFSNHPKELYRERINAIRWFEENHPDEFDLYGRGWETGQQLPINRPWKMFRKYDFVRKFFIKKYPSYRGEINDKISILETCNFSICYENAQDISGYITEKLFDCFYAGCVPVYLGANNIVDYVPENCFVDKRKFDSYDILYDYLKNITQDEYLKYQDNIKKYFLSDNFYPFSVEYMDNLFIKEIIKCT